MREALRTDVQGSFSGEHALALMLVGVVGLGGFGALGTSFEEAVSGGASGASGPRRAVGTAQAGESEGALDPASVASGGVPVGGEGPAIGAGDGEGAGLDPTGLRSGDPGYAELPKNEDGRTPGFRYGLEPPKRTGTGVGNLAMRLYLMTPFAWLTHRKDAKEIQGAAWNALMGLPKLLQQLGGMFGVMTHDGDVGGMWAIGKELPKMMWEGYKYDANAFVNGDLKQAGTSAGYMALDVFPFTFHLAKYGALAGARRSAQLVRYMRDGGRFADLSRVSAASGRFANLKQQATARFGTRFGKGACAGGACTSPGQCFVAGTPVLTDDGQVAIEGLALGARVETLGVRRPSAVTGEYEAVRLAMDVGAGERLEMSFLRPAGWTRANAEDGVLRLSLEEMGISGDASVLGVEPAPALRPGDGFVVTGTYTRLADDVVDLHVEGDASPLGVTERHRFFSETVGDWVAVRDLRVGDVLKTETGSVKVARLERRPGTHRVYNIEVEHEHTYLVGAPRLYTHNQYGGAGKLTDTEVAQRFFMMTKTDDLRGVPADAWNRVLDDLGAGEFRLPAALKQGAAKGDDGVPGLGSGQRLLDPPTHFARLEQRLIHYGYRLHAVPDSRVTGTTVRTLNGREGRVLQLVTKTGQIRATDLDLLDALLGAVGTDLHRLGAKGIDVDFVANHKGLPTVDDDGLIRVSLEQTLADGGARFHRLAGDALQRPISWGSDPGSGPRTWWNGPDDDDIPPHPRH